MQKFNSELNINTTHSPLRSSRLPPPPPKKKLMSAFVLILSNHFKQTNCSQSRWGQTTLKSVISGKFAPFAHFVTKLCTLPWIGVLITSRVKKCQNIIM